MRRTKQPTGLGFITVELLPVSLPRVIKSTNRVKGFSLSGGLPPKMTSCIQYTNKQLNRSNDNVAIMIHVTHDDDSHNAAVTL